MPQINSSDISISPIFPVPPGAAHAAFGMAAITAVGGAFGYYKTRSVRSLGAGVILGGMFAWAGVNISSGEPEKGFKLATLNGLALGAIMGMRFAKTKKVMPAGLLTVAGIGAAAYYGKLWNEFTS
jgi:uncharacterized membrane protein (UPF0136 family)